MNPDDARKEVGGMPYSKAIAKLSLLGLWYGVAGVPPTAVSGPEARQDRMWERLACGTVEAMVAKLRASQMKRN